jgi:phage FluMu protein gp41
MEAATTSSPNRTRRSRRLGIDAHTEFVGALVSELDSAVARMRAAAGRLAVPVADGEVRLVDPADIERPVEDLRRLVRLLEAIDGPTDRRHLQLLSLRELLEQAAKTLDVQLSVRGENGRRRFLGDQGSLLLGMELVLLAFTTEGSPVTVGVPNDRLVVIGGAFDVSDERQAWWLRCGRRVLEGENCRVRLISGRGGYRLEIRALGP